MKLIRLKLTKLALEQSCGLVTISWESYTPVQGIAKPRQVPAGTESTLSTRAIGRAVDRAISGARREVQGHGGVDHVLPRSRNQ